jgi:hypothetical protein
MRASGLICSLPLLVGLSWCSSCSDIVTAEHLRQPRRKSAAEIGPFQPPFREVADEVRLRFHHFSGATGRYYLPEIMGAGVALFDYDNDGDLDVYLLQGRLLDADQRLSDALVRPSPGWESGNRLFRNELVPGGKLRFTDVTHAAGADHRGYAMGVAVGDYDNDGYLDLYVTNFGSNVLLRNKGDGTFADVTRQAGVDDTRWSTSAAFVDYDRDGRLDLFVVNYLSLTILENKRCYTPTDERDYCGPQNFRPALDRLFRNLGKGTFTDVTQMAGIGAAVGPGLGVVCADFNGDGWSDIYVANDGTANHLWLNRRDGTFEEAALPAGVAYNADGRAQGSMGATAGDFDNDGDEDLFVTNLPQQGSILYRNNGQGIFEDATAASRVLHPTLPFTGFGTEWFDYDNDGLLDVFMANGAVHRLGSQRGRPYPFEERNQLFHNEGSAVFKETTAAAGAALQMAEVSRGAAFGDIDNDGDMDIVVTNNNGPARLLLNDVGNRRHWLAVRLRATRSNRHGIGARVGILRKGKPPLWRRCHTDGSYLSASDVRVHFGLGEDPEVQAIVVQWPDGSKETWDRVPIDTLLTLRQGGGRPIAR